MLPDRKPSYLLQAFLVAAAACAPVKPSPPPEPTPVRHCLTGEMDVGHLDIPSLPRDGARLTKVIGNPRRDVSIFVITRRGETICVENGTLNFGPPPEWADPRG